MIRTIFLISLVACMAGVTAAQSRDYPPTFEGARDKIYKSVDGVDLRLWLFEPEGHRADDSRPAIVFFFGGGWRAGSPGQFEPHCRYLASRGMVAITADYRVSSRHGVLADRCVADAKSAVRWVRQHAAELGIDPDRIAAGGGSAGGHLAACTAALLDLDEPDEDGSVSSVPNALALFNPALVLDRFEGVSRDEKKTEELAQRTGVSPKQISPIHHVRRGLPPTIIFHGEADTTVPYATAQAYERVCREAGNRCELIGFAGAAHGFFNHSRGSGPDDAYTKTIQELDRFLVSLGFLDQPKSEEPAVSSRLPAGAGDLLRPPIVVSPLARRIHRSAPVIDGHNDLPWAIRRSPRPFASLDLYQPQPQFHTDIPRLRTGGVGAQFWSVYVPADTLDDGRALGTTLEQIELVKQLVERYDDTFELALSTQDIERIRSEGKIASMIGVEGGHSIENSLSALRQLYELGARYMTLTHSRSLDWADSCTDEPRSGGLSEFGEEIVREMNRLGMLVDLSHVSADCMRQALQVTSAPVIFSHSSARSIADHPRNVPDDVLRLLPENGGVVMVNFYNSFVEPNEVRRSLERNRVREELRRRYPEDAQRATAELRKWEVANPQPNLCTAHHVLDHIEQIIRVAGIDHVGLGSDYDGIPTVPKQLEDVASYPVITQGLLDRGYSEADIRKVLGENLMRVFKQAEAVAER